MKRLLIEDLLSRLNLEPYIELQKSLEYHERVGSSAVAATIEFVKENKLADSYFINCMNNTFRTTRFELLLKRWIAEYLIKLFGRLNDSKELFLEDVPLNRFGTKKYYSGFGTLPKINWRRPPNLLQKFLSILINFLRIFYLSLNKGLRIFGKKKKYKVLREAVWGLYDVGGYFYHDDFFVDNNRIKEADLLLFSRGISTESGRLKGYHDAKKSQYAHFDLLLLSLGIDSLFLRIIPKYMVSSSVALFKEIWVNQFSLYWSIYLHFVYNALPYEKLFSHFEIVSEFAHNYFSAGHIPEAIICQNHNAKYYLMHWSDHSLPLNRYLLSFLGCDGFLTWGNVHSQGVEGNPQVFIPTGYIFKRFIKEVISNQTKVISDMGIVKRGKIIAFFDESFGNEFKMTGENYVVFWETALKVARMEKDHTIVVRPKKRTEYNNLREELKKKFFVIKNEMKKMQNVYIMQSDRWSFIEIVGISDLVITQGMTSSSTIAIICGIEGLYLDQAEHEHPFARLFKDKIVFDDPEKLISMIQKIISGAQHPLRDIPDSIIRAYDAYPDDRGIDLFRSILSDGPQKRVGVIIQARMGSTRLPGKVMRPILGKPMLEILIERLKRSKRRVSLIIATTQNKNDDIIAELARRLEVACFRGSQEDVLDRYYKAAKEYNMDVIVRITSDCPLADPALMDALIDYYFANPQIDYVSNTLKRTYPRGFDVEVFSFASLEKAAKEANKAYQREHVTPFIEENMKKLSYEDTRDSSIYRVTVDTMADFALITYIYELLHKNGDFGYRKIVDLLDSRPDLVALNKHIEQKII